MELGIYFTLRHKASGEFMPEAKGRKGYSHWNPSNPESKFEYASNTPRIFSTRRNADGSRKAWAANPNAEYRGYTNYHGEDDYNVISKPDGRTKEDLEVVEVMISEREVMNER